MKRIEIKRFYPEDWDTYKEGLMTLENASFDDPELCMTEEENKECMTDPEVYAYMALDGDRVVGLTYGNVLQKTDKDEFFEGHWEPKSYRHYDQPTLYITSTATLPEYRGMGIAKKLKYKMFCDLKENGFEYAIGHSNQGTMCAINSWFNGEVIETFEHWYGSEETHDLMEVDLSLLPVLLPVNNLKQLKDFDCGVASCAVLFGADEVPDHGESYITLGINPERGTSHEDLIQYALQVYGLRLSTDYECTILDITHRIDEGNLVIVNYTTEGEGHYSVIFGYDSDHIYIMDVWDGREKKIPTQEFLDNWYSKRYGYRWCAWF